MLKDDAQRFHIEQHQRQFKQFSRPYQQRDHYAAMDQAALRRTLPENSYATPAQYLASITAWTTGARGNLAAQRAMVAGLFAQGFARADIERALSLTPEQLDRLRADVAYTEPNPQPAHDFGSDFPLPDRGRERYEQIEKEREARRV
jgi:hypothetical protein